MERKILIVEDSQVMALTFSLPFLRRGYRVEMANDGKLAFQLLRSFAPDVVLLDLMLPKVRGSVILEAIRSNPSTEKLPVVVFTGSLLRPGEEVQIRRLANRFLHKAQTSPEQLFHVVDELLASLAAQAPKGASSPEPAPITALEPEVEIAVEPAIPLADAAKSLSEKVGQASSLPVHGASSPGVSDGKMPPEPADKMSAPHFRTRSKPAAPAKSATIPATSNAAKPALEPIPAAAPVESVIVEPPPPVKAVPPSQDNAAGLMQELESLARRLLAEQTESGQGALLEEMKARLQRLDNICPRHESGALGRLLAMFDDLVANLIQNRKDRSSSTVRTLMQACPVMQKIHKLNQSKGRTWQPALTQTLIVDDSLVSLKTVTRSLESISLSCEALSDPLEAITRLTASPFDLVLLDVDMPQMQGTDVCKKLRSLPRHAKTPVIFLTSLNRFDIRVTTARVGGDDFVTKPFIHSELAVKALTHIFRRHLDSTPS